MNVAEQIRRFARQTPDEAAIIADLVPISYGEFDRRITVLRRVIARAALPAGAIVVADIGDLVAGWTAILALRSLGLTTVAIREPADFAHLTGLDIAAVLTSPWEASRNPDGLAPPGALRIVLPREDLLEDESGPEPPMAAEPGAHILLTSATTGRFKMLRRDAARQRATEQEMIENGDEFYRGVANARMTHLFHFGIWTGAGNFFPPVVWRNGHTVVFHQRPDAHRSLSPSLTHAVLTPSLLAHLMAAPPDAFPRNDALQISVMGGALPEALWRETCARLTTQVITAIGSTEIGAWGGTRVEGPEDLHWHQLNPRVVAEVVDEKDAPLPPGRLGRVRIKNLTTSREYLNDDEASRAFFRDGFFYPGDLGVLNAEGRLRLYGRVTDVINVQGHKLPADPIEAALREELGVAAVCVLSEQAADASEVAHVVIETPAPIETERLRAAALAHLPGVARANFHFVAQLPRNHMGKIERLKLKQQLIAMRVG